MYMYYIYTIYVYRAYEREYVWVQNNLLYNQQPFAGRYNKNADRQQHQTTTTTTTATAMTAAMSDVRVEQ